jgi:hypothetical protein
MTRREQARHDHLAHGTEPYESDVHEIPHGEQTSAW